MLFCFVENVVEEYFMVFFESFVFDDVRFGLFVEFEEEVVV